MTTSRQLVCCTVASGMLTLVCASSALAQAGEGAEVEPIHLGPINLGVVVVYLLSMLSIGLWCSRKNHDTEQYFVASRKIPSWAAGLSVFGTQLSAITFIAVPATAFEENWVRLVASLMLMAALPLVIYFFLPFYRSVPATTVYEYLERRFSLPVRWLACLIWMTFTIGRMGIVLYIPSFALQVATGLDVYLCIVVMGLLVTVYSTLGGVEAVIWTDVIQVLVLLSGALLCVGTIFWQCGGAGEVVRLANDADKFALFKQGWKPVDMVPWVMIFGGVFVHLVPYTTDQTVAQRYFTTPSTRAAARGLWLNFFMTPFVLILFYLLGTALWVFYSQHSDLPLPTTLNSQGDEVVDANKVVPWFVVRQLPVGIAGLVIAAVFAATMSTLDSSINSIATAGVTDFYRRLVKRASEKFAFRLARAITLAMGLAGTLAAVWIAGAEQQLLFDQFNKLAGLLGGPVLAIFVLAIFTRRASSTGVIGGAIVAALTVFGVAYGTNVNFYLYAATGTIVGVAVGYALSLAYPDRARDLTGLTVFTRLSKADAELT